MDSVYGFQAKNVEAEMRNTSSFLHWLQHLLAIRREYPLFANGSLEVLPAGNPSVLAFLRCARGGEAGHQSVLTFPSAADQITWVDTGSAPSTGRKYGDPKRVGGQHGPAKGLMPPFAGSLSSREIQAVVQYEREKL